jgi:hypothetical protein
MARTIRVAASWRSERELALAARLVGVRGLGLSLCLGALACAASMRPVTETDTIAGARALDTSFRVKDRLAVPAARAREYILPVGEYRPTRADQEGIFYASPAGILERAGFSKRVLAGGIHVANAPGSYAHPSLYVELGDGRVEKLPMPAEVLQGYGELLSFAVNGEERVP